MSALAYLTLTQFKNRVKGMFRSPVKLIYALVVVALLVLVIVAGNMPSEDGSVGTPDATLGAIIVGYFALMFLMTANSGFSTGMSIFKMPDVNFLFVGPFKPVRILFQGMFNQMATALIMAVVMLFQYGWMHGSYGVGLAGMAALMVGYALVVFTAQITAMVIYAVSSGRPKVRKALRAVYVAVCVIWVAYIGYRALGAENALSGICAAAVDPFGRLFPVAGWLGGACYGVIAGDYSSVTLPLILWAVYAVALIVVMTRTDQDYYEDVLQSTETTFATQTAAKEGRVSENAPKNVNVGKTGLGGGWGASAFWFKHRIENRRSRKWLLSGIEIVFILVNIGFAFFMRDSGIVAPLAFAAYMMFFYVALGRLMKEMTKPYVYLVPEPPTKKLLWCMRESALGYAVSAVLSFAPMCFFVDASVGSIAAAAAAYFTYAYLFTAGNLVTERVFGGMTVKALIFLFYFVVLILMAAPGVVAAIFAAMVLPDWTALLILSGVNVLITLLAIFACRNILASAELNT